MSTLIGELDIADYQTHSDEKMAKLYLATKADFDAAVSETNGGKPLVVDFTANWFPPCQYIGPIYNEMVA